MAKKKSAASKGYRKTQQKKPFLTKKEIIALIIIVIVVVAAFIVINNLPDGYIGDSQVKEGDILSYATTDTRDRYLKLGTINDLEGFERTDNTNDTNAMVSYTFTPTDESSAVQYVTVGGSPIEAKEITETMMSSEAGYGFEVGEMKEIDVQGYNAYLYAATYSSYDETADETAEEAVEEIAEESVEETVEETAEEVVEETAEETTEETTEEAAEEETEEEPDPNSFAQAITLYVDCENEHTLTMHVSLHGTDDSIYISDADLADYIVPYTEAFTLLPKTEAEAK